MGKSVEVPQKFTILSSYFGFGYMSNRSENKILKRYMHYHVYDSIIYNSQHVEIACQSVAEWIIKIFYLSS